MAHSWEDNEFVLIVGEWVVMSCYVRLNEWWISSGLPVLHIKGKSMKASLQLQCLCIMEILVKKLNMWYLGTIISSAEENKNQTNVLRCTMIPLTYPTANAVNALLYTLPLALHNFMYSSQIPSWILHLVSCIISIYLIWHDHHPEQENDTN